MNKDKKQVYFSYTEQLERFKKVLPEVQQKYQYFQLAKKSGNLPANDIQRIRLFDV